MKFWMGVTDNSWFQFLAARDPDEVNFWHPSATSRFTALQTGTPFLFKLKRPNNHIAGGGFFVTHSTLPLSLAWEVFGDKNGAASLAELRDLIGPLRGGRAGLDEIGCTVLANPFFLRRDQWIPSPPGWSSNIVQGKTYDSDEPDGRAIWAAIEERLHADELLRVGYPATQYDIERPGEKYGQQIMVKPRLGQSSFRVLVTDAYKRRCAITGESTLLALEAAHIVPYSEQEGVHDVRNGLLLRADFHRLFDAGLLSVAPDLRIKVSPRIREAWFNGKAYYRLNDRPLSVLPDQLEQRPDSDRLDWHYKNKFQA
ncbi:MAG TPA: HNH endonuclease [Rhodanobacteraceae bacterium]|nr:HNH endonuclease [Rhodanobacteraceae bacterium]